MTSHLVLFGHGLVQFALAEDRLNDDDRIRILAGEIHLVGPRTRERRGNLRAHRGDRPLYGFDLNRNEARVEAERRFVGRDRELDR